MGFMGYLQSFSGTPEPTGAATESSGAAQVAQMGQASLSSLQTNYKRWAKAYRKGNPRGPVLALKWSKGRSSEYSSARGIAQIDLAQQRLSLRLKDHKDQGVSEVWLLENRPGAESSALPEPGDRLVYAGQLSFEKGGVAWLDTQLVSLASMRVDSVIVARPGQDLQAQGVLYGNTTLFQKIFHYPKFALNQAPKGAGFQMVASAHASGLTPRGYSDALSAELVNEGRRLFFNETFGGNGRTCGTCHHEDDNLALSLRTIASLPADDPLFIVEQEFRRDGTRNALYQDYRMEKPELMRKAGLILENLDGFREGDGSFTERAVMRAPQHILSLRTTLAPPPAISDDGTLPLNPDDLVFVERTGWTGDGSPTGFDEEFLASNERELTGSLRDFTVGAIRQHFPLTLERSSSSVDADGVARTPDFRMPTERELDALEAFMLSTGSTAPRDELTQIRLKDEIAERGRRNYLGFNVFDATPDDGRPPLNCQACHFNGGALTNPEFPFPESVTPSHDLDDLLANGGSIPTHNRSFGPGVERLADQAPDVIVQVSDAPSVRGNCSEQGLAEIPLLPTDEPGVPSQGCDANPFDNGFQGVFGEDDDRIVADRFNVPPVFEAMDNPPFFHGHQINTIEGMVAFYATNRHFRNGDFAGAIVPLNAPQVVNVARFLRVMGADFNLRAAVELLIKAAGLSTDQGQARSYNAYLASQDIEDAIRLLDAADIHFQDVVPALNQVLGLLKKQPMASGSERTRRRSYARAEHRGYRNHGGRRDRDHHHDRGRDRDRDHHHDHHNEQKGPAQEALLDAIRQLRSSQSMMIEREGATVNDRARVESLKSDARGYVAPVHADVKRKLREISG